MDIYNPFKNAPIAENLEDIESEAGQAEDAAYYFQHSSSVKTLLASLRQELFNGVSIQDAFLDSTDSDGNTIFDLLITMGRMYNEIEEQVLESVKSRDEWVENFKQEEQYESDIRADYRASIL